MRLFKCSKSILKGIKRVNSKLSKLFARKTGLPQIPHFCWNSGVRHQQTSEKPLRPRGLQGNTKPREEAARTWKALRSLQWIISLGMYLYSAQCYFTIHWIRSVATEEAIQNIQLSCDQCHIQCIHLIFYCFTQGFWGCQRWVFILSLF